MSSVGSTKAATRSSIASYSGYRAASRALNLAISRARQLRVRPQGERAAVGQRREGRRAAREHLEAVVAQAQVADDLLAEEAVDVGRGRDLEAREGLLGHAGAAHQIPPLQHEHAQPGARQVARGDEPVVPRADHDRVVPAPATRGHRRHSITWSARSRNDGGDRQAERLGGLEIDEQLVLGGLLDRQVTRPCPLQDAVDVDRHPLPPQLDDVRAVGHEAPRLRHLPEGRDEREPVLDREIGDPLPLGEERRARQHQERLGAVPLRSVASAPSYWDDSCYLGHVQLEAQRAGGSSRRPGPGPGRRAEARRAPPRGARPGARS